MNIPYRTRQNLKRAGIVALAVLVAAMLAGLFWFMWLERFVVYTRDLGAVLDMQLSEQLPEGKLPSPPEYPKDVPIYYNEGENAIHASQELVQLTGYYADAAALRKDVDSVMAQVKDLPANTPVMVDVKNPKGAFFYTTSITTYRDKGIDPVKMDALIAYLNSSNLYTIARLPALRNYIYGVDHVSDGLDAPGGYLWADSDYCYWLDPTSQGTMTHLIQIVSELKALGFDEVVFDEFRFPDTDRIVFKGNREEAIAKAASTLVTTCTTNTFTVSFVSTKADFPLPEGRSRLYLKGVAAIDAEATAAATGLADPAIRLVYLTEVHDTRYDICSVLRPLEAAH